MCLTYDKEIAPKMFGYRIKFIKEKMTQFQKGNPGRPKGAKNIFPQFMRDRIQALFGNNFELIQEDLKNEKQIIIYMNRLGYGRYIKCKGCQKSFDCPNCDIIYTSVC
mgnify:CR=1 FL=1